MKNGADDVMCECIGGQSAVDFGLSVIADSLALVEVVFNACCTVITHFNLLPKTLVLSL